MPLLNFQQFLNGVEESLNDITLSDSSISDDHIQVQSRPKLPEDILSTIFDIFTLSNLGNLQIAVRVNTFLYSRYRSKLYRYITLDSKNIGDFQLHAGLSLASSGQTGRLKRARDRFTALCHSVIHLEIMDQGASQGLVEMLSSSKSLEGSQSLFKNVIYLALRNGFMRFLEISDDRSVLELQSEDVVHLLSRYLNPKHLCIEKLRVFDKKDPKSPEVCY